MTTDRQIIEKLKDIKESFSNLSNRYYMWSSMAIIYKQDLDPLIAILESEISALEQQIKEGEVSYPANFVEWLKDECETELDLSTGKYVFVNEDAKEISFIMTTEEAFDYWQSKVKNEKK